MLDWGITTYILTIIWLYSFLMIIAALKCRKWLIVVTALSVFLRFVPEEYFQEIANSYNRNVHIMFPVIVVSLLSAFILGYIYMFSYICRYQPGGLPPNSKESSDSD